MRNFIPQQEKFYHFSELINAAKYQYTLSFKDACKALKCSRSWAQKYIRPHVPTIYLTNGKGTDKVRQDSTELPQWQAAYRKANYRIGKLVEAEK